MAASELSLFEIADRVSMLEHGWSVVLAAPDDRESVAGELVEELKSALEEGEAVAHVRAEGAPFKLVASLLSVPARGVAVVTAVANLDLDAWHLLDSSRNAILKGPSVVYVGAEDEIRLLAVGAPNLWSWIGPRIWGINTGLGVLAGGAQRSKRWCARFGDTCSTPLTRG